MSGKQKKVVARNGISCVAFNGDGSMVALCPNNETVLIYRTNGSLESGKWAAKPDFVLNEHTELVSSIDWSPSSNFLLTCSHDRNAYVWSFSEAEDAEEGPGKWTPSLVILRINRAAIMCRWSPFGNKFAVASSAKCVPVCHYEAKRKWWVSKAIRKHKSTVLAVAWCPNNKFIVTGATDYRCRIMSAYLEGLDSEDDEHGFAEIFPKQHEFGAVLAEFDAARAWVHDVAWAPGGFRLAFSGHGSTIHMVQLLADGPAEVTTMRHGGLPFLSVEFLSDRCVIASGYDRNPHIYQASDSDGAEPRWTLVGKADKEKGDTKKKKAKSAFKAAAARFESMATRGEKASGGVKEAGILTRHWNAILQTCVFPGKPKLTNTFVTVGMDGRVVRWALKKSDGFDPAELCTEVKEAAQ